MNATVTVGLPTHNRPEYLRLAVDSLLAQTFGDFKLIISDNASENPAVGALIDDYVARDSRVRAVRRSENVGAERNFKDLMAACNTPYFMWASDDDVWEPTFIAEMMELLRSNPRAQMAAAKIDNINLGGAQIRTYEDFSRFSACDSRTDDARRFILDSEILGKANLIYGLFRTPALHAVCAENWDNAGFSEWGGDYVLLYAFISRHPIVVSDQLLLHKRVPVESEEKVVVELPASHFVPPEFYRSYVERYVRVSPTPELASLARRLLRRRLVESRLLGYWQKSMRRARRLLRRANGSKK